MSILGILAITAITVLSVVAVFVAEEPVDTVAEVEAAITGMAMMPLSSKVATSSRPKPGKNAYVSKRVLRA